MAKVYEIDGVVPVVDPDAFVQPDAVLIGDVIIGPHCYVGPCACLRGDMGGIRLAEGANVQDTCVIHSFPEVETVIAEEGHIGHGAILHGCHVGINALVGMHAVIMDGANVGDHAIVAAMSLVKAGMKIPAGTLAAGIPARIVRELSVNERVWMDRGADEYRRLTVRSIESLKPAAPLTRPEKDRKRLTCSRMGSRPLHEYKIDKRED
jgi:phenylacetic acid degradation protein